MTYMLLQKLLEVNVPLEQIHHRYQRYDKEIYRPSQERRLKMDPRWTETKECKHHSFTQKDNCDNKDFSGAFAKVEKDDG
jgi:hypothetical protein